MTEDPRCTDATYDAVPIATEQFRAAMATGDLNNAGAMLAVCSSMGWTDDLPLHSFVAAERIAAALEGLGGRPFVGGGGADGPNGEAAYPDLHLGAASQGGGLPVTTPAVPVEKIASIEAQLSEIHAVLMKQGRVAQATDRKFYTVPEVAELTGFKEWTIRQACNKGRIKGKKGDDGRWRLPHEELLLLQEAGLPAE